MNAVVFHCSRRVGAAADRPPLVTEFTSAVVPAHFPADSRAGAALASGRRDGNHTIANESARRAHGRGLRRINGWLERDGRRGRPRRWQRWRVAGGMGGTVASGGAASTDGLVFGAGGRKPEPRLAGSGGTEVEAATPGAGGRVAVIMNGGPANQETGGGPNGTSGMGAQRGLAPMPLPDGLVVHEWGTNTVVSASDGTLELGLQHEFRINVLEIAPAARVAFLCDADATSRPSAAPLRPQRGLRHGLRSPTEDAS